MAENIRRGAGITAREIDLSQPQGVSPTGTPAAVIGVARTGPAFVPVTVANFSSFVARFGDVDSTKFGAMALQEWMVNRSAGTFLRVLGAGDGKKRTTSGNNSGKVTNAGFVAGQQEIQQNGNIGANTYVMASNRSPEGVDAELGRTYILGCFMSESLQSTNKVFTAAGIGENSGDSAATATITFSGNVSLGETITIISTDKTSKVYTAAAAEDLSAREFDGDTGGANAIAGSLGNCILNAAGHNGTILATLGDSGVLNLTQNTGGSDGNRTIVDSGLGNTTIVQWAGGGVGIVDAAGVGSDVFILTNDESFLGNTDSDDKDYSTDYAVITNNTAGTPQALTSSYRFPSAILRAASNQPGSNFAKPTQPYFGVDVALSGSTKYAPSTSEVLRALPASLITYTRGSNDESSGKVVPSHIFTLDNIVVPGLGDTTSDTSVAKYVSGSRKNVVGTQELDTVSVTAQSGAYFLLTASSMGYNKFTTVFHGGFDGLDVTEADPFRNTFMGSSATETTNYAFYSLMRAINTVKDPEVVECNMMSVPGLTNTTLTDYLIDSCEERADALAIIDLANDYIPDADTKVVESDSTRRPNVDQAVNVLKSRQLNSSYGACYFPWVQIRDTLSNKILAMPPSVVALGAISYSESVRELWFAPAGFTRGGLSAGTAGLTVLNTKHHLTSEERDKLYEVNVNPIASFPAEGVVIFGQKTLQATTSALDRINVRRLLIHIKKEVSRIAATILFEQNVQATWLTFTAQVDAFLVEIKAGLGLTDYKIVLDETTTTPDLIDRNILYAKIFLKPAQAIEFIALDFIVTDSGASFAD